MRLLLFLTSDMPLPPEKLWSPPVLGMDKCVTQDIRYYKTSPSHLHHSSVDKQLLPKRHTLPVLCYICLNSLLVPPCWRHVSESSTASHTLPKCRGNLLACTPPVTLGTASPVGAPEPHQWQLFPSAASEQVVGSEGTTLLLHGLQFLLCA